MKLRNLIFSLVASAAAVGLAANPTWATDIAKPDANAGEPVVTSNEPTARESEPVTTSDTLLPPPTFSSEEIADDAGAFWFGKNLLFAGNNATARQISRGLLFAAGNNLRLETQSEYAFAAGNNLTLTSAATEKDLFVAGNTVSILDKVKIGRDLFAAGNTFLLQADVPGDVSVGANKVVLDNVTIKGNVNLDAEYITFQSQVKIIGTLSYNDDASLSGLTNVEYGKLETYTPTSHTTTAGEIWLAKMMSVIGLFFTITIILLVFPRTKTRLAREADVQRFGVDLMIGLVFVIAVPLLSLLFLMSFFAASTGIFLIGVYLLIFYLAKAFAGAWLGHVIVEKLCRGSLPMILEALIGILIITCVAMIPGLGFMVSVLALVLGSGLIIACLRSGSQKSSDDKRVYYAAADADIADSSSTKPSRSSKSATPKSSVSKSLAPKSSSIKSSAKSATKPAAAKSSPKTAKNSAAKTAAKTPKSRSSKTK